MSIMLLYFGSNSVYEGAQKMKRSVAIVEDYIAQETLSITFPF